MLTSFILRDWEAMRNRTVLPPWVPDFVKGHFFFDDWGTIEHPEPGCALDRDEDDILPDFAYVSPNLLQGIPDDSMDPEQTIPEESLSHLFKYGPGNGISVEAFCNCEFDEADEDAHSLHSDDMYSPIASTSESKASLSPSFYLASSLVNLWAPECIAGAVPDGPAAQCSQPATYTLPEPIAELTEPPFKAKLVAPEVHCPQTGVHGPVVERFLRTESKPESSVQCPQSVICNTPEPITDHAAEHVAEHAKFNIIVERTKPLRFATLPSVKPVVQFTRAALFQPVLEPLAECAEATIEPTFLSSTNFVMPPNEDIKSCVVSLYSKAKSWLKELLLWVVNTSILKCQQAATICHSERVSNGRQRGYGCRK